MIPVISSITNVILTDLYLIPNDWVDQIVVGIVYTAVNGMATVIRGRSVYPIVNWQNGLLTIVMFLMVSITMAMIHIGSCVVLRKFFKRRSL